MKYIFVTGAPGSKWSSVVKNIYWSPDINHTDYCEARTYWHDAPGHLELMHTGAYFDPEMEFGQFFHRLNEHDHYQCETEFDAPFSGPGIKIIKSHVFANHIDYIRQTWPDYPIVLVHRPDDACLGWWVKCGHFDITYPSYGYYKGFRDMAQKIQQQNAGIVAAMRKYNGLTPLNNHMTCKMLNITLPPAEYSQDYGQSDVRVTII